MAIGEQFLQKYRLFFNILAPTTKAVGSIDITKLEPTALVVGSETKIS